MNQLLSYCIIAANKSLNLPQQGVRNRKVECLEHLQLHCFFSSIGDLNPASQQDAVRFHEIIAAIFSQAAVIPFRFPALIESQADLKKFIEEHAMQYREVLTRLQDAVQMELRISTSGDNTVLDRDVVNYVSTSAVAENKSGTQYLETRRALAQSLESVAQQAREAAGDLILDWRCRPSAQPDGLRCYALILRPSIEEFRRRTRAGIPQNQRRIKVSGPWPWTEFL